MTYETIKFDIRDDGIATMILNRPERMNCFNQKMFAEWQDVTAKIAYDDSIRVLIITGEGRAFSSGVDLSILGSEKSPPAFRYYYRQNHQGFDNLETVEVPVIAAINGICFGGGVELALSSDIRIAAETAKLGLTFARLGILPGLGSTHLLPRLVGRAKALKLVLTARVILAPEAAEIGLVNRVVPAEELLEEARSMAQQMAESDPAVLAAAKRAIHFGESASMAEAMANEQRASAELRKTRSKGS